MSETSAAPSHPLRRLLGRAWRARLRALPLTAFERDFVAAEAHTMLGFFRLRSLHALVRNAIRDDVQGDIVECGVARGGSALLMALALERAGARRTLWLFDAFEGMPEPDPELNPDHVLASQFTGACRGEEDDVRALILGRCPSQDLRVLKGLFADTMRAPGVERIAVAHLDGDWYESMKPCLDALWPRVSAGGSVQVDDYGGWLGCRRAVDEFLAAHPGLVAEPVDISAIRIRKPR